MKKEMFLKQTGKGNKSSEPEDNTASREATTETTPLFIYFNSLPTFKAIKSTRSVCSALQILHVSHCSVCGNKWIFPPFQLKLWGLFHDHQQHKDKTVQELYTTILHSSTAPAHPNPAIPGKETPRRLSTSFQQWAAQTEQRTVWCANVTVEHTPQAALGSIPTILFQDGTGKQVWAFPAVCTHPVTVLAIHHQQDSSSYFQQMQDPLQFIYCRPSAASRF